MNLVSPTLRAAIRKCLADYRSARKPAGIIPAANFDALLLQLYDSVRRVEYFFALRQRDVSPSRADPHSPDFDPVRAAVLSLSNNNVDEAAWLAFLFTHFGHHPRTRWGLVQQIYGRLGAGPKWDWAAVQGHLPQFMAWLAANTAKFNGSFGNHRKYTSLKPGARAGTSEAFQSYVAWVRTHSSHAGLLATLQKQAGSDPGDLFEACFRDMRRNVRGFARTGCFDYLCALGKLGIYPIEPNSPFISGSTGPRRGAEVLLEGSWAKKDAPAALDKEMRDLGESLAKVGVRFSMQVVEDAICNWQKSPSKYKTFRG